MPFSPMQKLMRRRQQKAAVRAFERFPIRPGDVVIDGGANFGLITLYLLGRGARVIAYEPNPDAFRHLHDAFGQHPRVECIRKGLSDTNGTASLYLHQRYAEDALHYSEASSLLADKRNVDGANALAIPVVDVADAVMAAGERVRLLKLDIEGSEYRVLHRLIDTGMIHRIDQVFCETHERKIPSLRRETGRLRKRLKAEGITHVNLDWL